MVRRSLSALGRLIAMALFGTLTFLMVPLVLLGFALLLALGLVSVIGLFGGLIYLLVGSYRTGLMLLGAGAGAWVANMLIWDRVFAARDLLTGRSGKASGAIPSSSLRIDFDR